MNRPCKYELILKLSHFTVKRCVSCHGNSNRLFPGLSYSKWYREVECLMVILFNPLDALIEPECPSKSFLPSVLMSRVGIQT